MNYRPVESNKNNNKTYRILSLDGGGIRGLVSAVWLQRLEEKLGSPLNKHFDLIAGTSTGSILACGISLGISPTEMIKVYSERGKEIFPSSALARILKYIKHLGIEGIDQPIYSSKGLETVLRDVFQDQKFGTLSTPTLVVSYDTLNRKAVPFKSNLKQYAEIPIWEICKASSSAPLFFPAHIMEMNNGGATYKIPMIDGGVVASNPTACAIAEGVKLNNARPEDEKVSIDNFVVVSLSTGDANRPIHIRQAKNWGYLKWAANITGVLFDGVSQAAEHIASSMLPEENYFRFQAKLERDSLDDVSWENLNALKAFANNYFSSNECSDKMQKLIQKLRFSSEDKSLGYAMVNNEADSLVKNSNIKPSEPILRGVDMRAAS